MSTAFYSLTDTWVLSYTSPEVHPGTITVTKPVAAGDASVFATSLVVPTSGVYGLRLRNGSEAVRLYLGEYLSDVPANSIHVDLPTAPVTLALAATTNVPAAYLTPAAGLVTTSDPGPLPPQFTIVFKERQTEPTTDYCIVSQDLYYFGGRSWNLGRQIHSPDRWQWYQFANGDNTAVDAVATSVGGASPTIGSDETYAVSINQNDAGQRRFTTYRPDGAGGWTQIGSNVAALNAMFDSSAAIMIGSHFDYSKPWPGRIYSVELRTGLDPNVGSSTSWAPSHLSFPGVVGNGANTTVSAIPADPSQDVRVEFQRPSTPSPGFEYRVSADPLYLLFSNSQVGAMFFASDASFPSMLVTNATFAAAPGMPAVGQWMQMRQSWDAATDVLTLYWRAAGTDLGNDTGWNTLGTQSYAGKQVRTDTTTWALTSPNATYVFPGGVRRWYRRLNGAVTHDIDARYLTDVNAITFTARTGQIVTITRSGTDPKVQIVPMTSGVIWKFDANDYPGSGTSYVDPRGRTWTLTNAAAITQRTVIEVVGSYSLDEQSWTTAGTASMVGLPTHADLFFEQFSTSDSVSASFRNYRALAGTTALPYPEKHTFFRSIGTGPTSQPPALTPSQEAVIHALVGAQFGDLEFDIGKSVRWTQWFCDDVFITDVNYGDPRFWIVDWAASFPFVNYRTAGGGVSFFDDPVTFRKRQFSDAEQFARDNAEALVFDNNDWVLWVDAHEGMSVDNTAPFPPDYDFDLFRSYVAREIRTAIEAGKDRILLPFYIYVRHANIQNVEYDWLPNQPEGGNKCVQSMGVPYYLPYQGLLRLMKVSALRNPNFNWSSIDQPQALALDAGVEAPHFNPSAGTVSTPDAADLNITTDVRFTARVRDDSTEALVTRNYAAKSTTGTESISWRFGNTYSTHFYVLGYPLGTPAPQLGAYGAPRSTLGLTPPGQDRYVGVVMTGVGSTAALSLRGQATTSTDGVTWTNVGTQSGPAIANMLSNDSASPLLIGQTMQGRLYWAQMERINQRKFVTSPGAYLTTPGTAGTAPAGDMTVIMRVKPNVWPPGGANYPSPISQRGGALHAWSLYFSPDGTLGGYWYPLGTQASQSPFNVHIGGMVSLVAGQWKWIAVTLDIDNGSGGSTFRTFEGSDGVTWTAVGAPASRSPSFAIPPVAPTFIMGATEGGALPWEGEVEHFSVRNGTGASGVPGGTEVFRVTDEDATGWTSGAFPSSSPGRYVGFANVPGNRIFTPDAPNLNITGDIEIVAYLRPVSWAAATTRRIVTKDNVPRGWSFGLSTGGQISLTYQLPGATTSSTAIPLGAGVPAWVKVTRVATTGALAYYWAADSPTEPTTWTAIGTGTTNVIGPMLANDGNLDIGVRSGTVEPFDGQIRRVIIRNGIAGPTVFDFNAQADLINTDPAANSFVCSTGQTLTVVRSGSPTTELASYRVTPVGSVVQTAPDELMWRFDAAEYPGTGTSYTDPRGRTWTVTPAAMVPYQQPDVRLQVVSYAYAHWNLQDIPPGETGVPALTAENDLGWQQRNLISKVRPVPGLPYGATWQFPTTDVPGLPGPWAPDTFDGQVTGVVIPKPRPSIDPAVASVRVPLYDSVLRLNTRDGVWYAGEGTGNVPLEWDETSQSWKPPLPQETVT